MLELGATVTAVLLLLAFCTIIDAADADTLPEVAGYKLYEAETISSVDGSAQPIVVGHPQTVSSGAHDAEPLPLLVGVHSWSVNRLSSARQQAKVAADHGWLAVFPDFRGPNLTSNPHATEAGASLLAQRDIIDAVEHMKSHFPVDSSRIYIMGGSGGGHMSLMMACKYPDVWAAVSAWCPITCMRQWWEQQNSYSPHIEAVCGGKPGDSAQVDFEYLRRSPRSFIANCATIPVAIHHGQMDPTIFCPQTWQTFSLLADIPDHYVIFASDSTGHFADYVRGAAWLEGQIKSDRPPDRLTLATDEAKWFFWCFLAPAREMTLATAKVSVDRSHDQPKLTISARNASQVRIDLDALGVKLTETQLGAGATVEDAVLTLLPPTPGADIGLSTPVAPVR